MNFSKPQKDNPVETNKIENKVNMISEEMVIEALSTVYDPEIPLNVYDLGLIYAIRILNEDGIVEIDMTLTSPNCPSIESLPSEVEEKVGSIDGVKDVRLQIIWDPPFSIDMMSDEARLTLGLL